MWRQLRWALPVHFVMLFTAFLPDNRFSLSLRGWLVSLFLRKCGVGLQVGRDVTLLSTDRLSIGSHCYLAKGTWLNAMGGVEIEDEVITSPYVVISSSNHGFKDGSVRFGGAHPAPIRIGKGSWLAAHSVVTAGVKIGKGCLVGANSVVARDVADHMFVGGVPAKEIRVQADNPSEIFTREQIVIY